MRFHQLRWKRIVDTSRNATTKRLFDPFGEFPGFHATVARLGVNRNNATRSVADQVDDRIRHLQSTAIGVGLAPNGNGEPDRQLFVSPRLIEKRQRELASCVANANRDHRATIARHALVDGENFDNDERLHPGQQVFHPTFIRAVHPSAWIMHDQVEQRRDVHCFQIFLTLFTYAMQFADTQICKFDEANRRLRRCLGNGEWLLRHRLIRPRRGTGRAAARLDELRR